jgi:NADH-quinone oxidoreductase subunit H
VLYIVAVGALSTLSIIMAGWSSKNKYAMLGAFRTVAQMVSYEVPMVVSLLVPVIIAGTMGINAIVQQQEIWYILVAPVAAGIFLITSIAELGRAPFDLVEAESEIVAGFHIEYTGMKFGLFYAGELLHALTIGGIFSALFLGGWRGPGAEAFPILGTVYFFLKAFFLYWVIMWVKYSLPRIRIDQMLNFNWKFLTPLALVTLMVTAVAAKALDGYNPIIYTAVMLGINLLLVWATLQIVRTQSQSRPRPVVSSPRPVARPPKALVVETPVDGDGSISMPNPPASPTTP